MANKANSLKGVVDAALAAAAPIPDPPACVRLEPAHRPFWNAIIVARSAGEWTEADYILAAKLARTQHQIEALNIVLAREGVTVVGGNGLDVVNPVLRAIDILTKHEAQSMRLLRIGGHAGGDPRDQAGKRKAEREARGLMRELESADPDGLLAR